MISLRSTRIGAMLLMVAAWVVPFKCAGYELGRLFTTPEQRHELDELRNAENNNHENRTPAASEAPEAAVKPETPVGQIMVRGIVTRSDGENAAWINNDNTYQGNPDAGAIRVNPGDIHRDKVRIVIPDANTSVSIKVGQTYDPVSRRVVDLVPPDAQPPTAGAPPQPGSHGP